MTGPGGARGCQGKWSRKTDKGCGTRWNDKIIGLVHGVIN